MSENLTPRQRVAIITAAALANGVFFSTLFALEWYNIDYQKWFGLALFTALAFGVALHACSHGLWNVNPLLIFGALLTIHLVICIWYLCSESEFPLILFAVLSPFEAVLVASIMKTFGGVRLRLLGRRRFRPTGKVDHAP